MRGTHGIPTNTKSEGDGIRFGCLGAVISQMAGREAVPNFPLLSGLSDVDVSQQLASASKCLLTGQLSVKAVCH